MTPLESVMEAPAKEKVNISLRIKGSNIDLALPVNTEISDLTESIGANFIRRRTEASTFRLVDPTLLKERAFFKDEDIKAGRDRQIATPDIIIGPWQSHGRIYSGCYEVDQYNPAKLQDYISQYQI